MIEQSEYDVMSDDALALEAHGGDRVARNTLYLRHTALISRRIIPARRLARCLAASGAPIDARDVEQEAFVIFCALIDEWEPERTPFVPFMAAMIWRRACKYVRQYQHLRSKRVRVVPMLRIRSLSHGAGPGGEIGDGELLDALQPPQFRPPEGSDERALAELLNWEVLVGTLRADWRRFVQLRFWEDRSSRQIASREGCSPRTVNRGLSAALAQIKWQLAEDREAI